MIIQIPRFCQMHDHWRIDELLRSVAEHQSLCEYSVVMPNLRLPVLDAHDKNVYRAAIMHEPPRINAPSLLMTCQLTPATRPGQIRDSREKGVFAFKAYSQGVTTNSDLGFEDWNSAELHQQVAAAGRVGMPILLHLQDKTLNPRDGELSALCRAMPLIEAHKDVLWSLEHLTTREAIEYVEALQKAGFKIVCTLTMHHGLKCSDCVQGNPFLKVQPPLQTVENVDFVLNAILSGKHIKGRDAAGHLAEMKNQPFDRAPSGIWTPDEVDIPLTFQTFEYHERGTDWRHRFNRFVSGNAHLFYGSRMPYRMLPSLNLVREDWEVSVPTSPLNIVPFMAGEVLRYRVAS